MRLDALGERLTGLAGLEQAEFDFRNPPPLGGPSTETLRATGVPDIEQALAELAASLAARETQLRFVESYLRDSGLAERALPSGRPVEESWISSRFGQRIDPLNGRSTLHEGIDLAGKAGSEVRAVAAGLVTWSGRYAGYGELVELDHGNGYVTRYAHNRENLVAVGARVDKGQPIARLGSTGRSTGPHVHFEVLHEGRPVNPERYVRASR
jgi:murein DD-endopeptidase MepM/ murein hydrolase activator NlpD